MAQIALKIKALSRFSGYNSKLTTKRAGTNRPFFLVDRFFTCRLGGLGEQNRVARGYSKSLNKPSPDWVTTWWRSNAPPGACCASRSTCPGSRGARRGAVRHGRGLREGHAPAAVRAGGGGRRVQAPGGVVARVSIAPCATRRISSVLPARWSTSRSRRRWALAAARAGQPPTARSFAARWSACGGRRGAGRSSGATSPPVKPGQKVSKKRVPAPLQVLGFTLDELREARLAPIVDFKGRASAGRADVAGSGGGLRSMAGPTAD